MANNGKTGFTIEINGKDQYLKDFNEIKKKYKEHLDILKTLEVGTEKYFEQQKTVAELKNGVSEFNRELRKQAKEFEHIEKGVSAYKELEKETRKLKNESKELAAQLLKLEKAGKANTDEYKDLEKQYIDTTKKAQDFDKELKEIDETVGDSFRNVGNYKGAFKEAFEESGIGVEGFNNKLKLIAKNPFILIVTVLVGSLKLLFDAFKQSKTGAELLNKVAGITKGLFSVLVSIVDTFAKNVLYAFENPKQAILDFGESLKNNIMDRVKSMVSAFGSLGKVIQNVLRGDFKAAAESAKTASKEFGDAINVIPVNKIKETINEITETAKAFSALEAAKRNAIATNASLTKQLEDLTTKEELYNQAAGDSSLSLKEQQAAAESARKALEDRAAVQIKLAQNGLSLIRQEIGLRQQQGEDVTSLLDSEVSAYSELKGAQREYTLAVKQNATERRMISRDEVERTLDFLIDGVDNQKTINERLLNDEKLTFEQRAKILKDTKGIFDSSFSEQIKTIENFAGIQIDANSLINESNAKVLDEKVRALGVDDIIAGRLLEIIRDRKTGIQDLAEAESDLNEKRIEGLIEAAEIESEIAKQLNEIKFEKGLISQERFNKSVLESDLDRLNAELENSELKGNEKLQLENEIELKRLEIKKAAIETDLSDIDRKYEIEADKANKAYLDGELKASEHEAKLLEIDEIANAEKLEYLQDNADENIEFVKELADKELEIQKSKNQKILDDEKETQEKKIALASEINGKLRDITNALFESQLAAAEGNEAKQLEIQRKQFNANKVFTIGQIIIDTSAAIMKTLGQYGTTPIGITLSALAGITGATQIASVASQAPPMADGGFTGRGGQVDETGERTTGIYRLHEGEYVAPRSQVNSMPSLFSQLDNNRRTGASLMTANNTNQNDNKSLLNAIKSMTNNIQVVADSEEIVRLGNTKSQLKKSKNL